MLFNAGRRSDVRCEGTTVKVAVIGHVEWIEFVRVEHVPAAGEIVHASETWGEAAGGGAVAAVQLANLNGSVLLFTALGHDDVGRRSLDQLRGQAVTVHAATAREPQRRGFTYVDAAGERTITVLGDKLRPEGDDPTLPWEELLDADAVFFVSGDVAALRQARKARVLVATARELPTLQRAGVGIDVLVASGEDEGERYRPGDLDPAPDVVVTTAGALGGWIQPGGPYLAAALDGPLEDTYGAGDCFAAGLTFALGRGDALEAAVAFGARCGAAVLTGRGPYGGQLRLVPD
jgi:ribokinase